MNWLKKLRTEDISKFFGILLGLIVACIGIFLINRNIHLDDAYWHIKTGEWINQNGLISNCIGSWSSNSSEWIAHEWLFGLLLYYINKIGTDVIIGFFDIVFLFTLYVSWTCAGLNKKSDKFPTVYLGIVLVSQIIVYAMCMTARPQYLTVLFVALFLMIIEKSLNDNTKLLLLLPLITLCWTNIHGGTTLLSYFILLLYLICNSFDYQIGKIYFKKAKIEWVKWCFISFILCIISIIINPYGTKMLLYPYQNMQDELMIKLIGEWRSPDAKNIVILIFFILPMFMGIISLIQYEKEVKASDVAIFFLFIILFLRSKRFYPFVIVAQTSLITKYGFYLPSCRKTKKEKKINRFANNTGFLLIGIICICATAYSMFTADYLRIEGNKDIPDNLLECIKADNPQRIFNHYDVGGYLLYNDIEVFVDGRYEPYRANEVINDFVKLAYPKDTKEYREFDKLIEKYQFDSYLLKQENDELIMYLENQENIECIYNDDEWIYMIDKSKK